MNKTLLASVTIVTMVFSQNLLADHSRHARSHEQYIDYARVVHVEPVYKTIRIAVPVQHCRQENIQRPAFRRVSSASPGDVLLGGIIGGIIGHELGDRHNRDLTTVAGAIIGSNIASEANTRYYRTADYRRQQREFCTTTTQYRTEQQLVGYRVAYRYRGEIFTTRMREHPGKRIAVKVDVAPVRHRH